MRDDIPTKGDPRYPTIAGTLFVGVFLVLAAIVLSMWLDLGVWPYVVAGAILLYLVVVNLWTVGRQRRRDEVIHALYGPEAREMREQFEAWHRDPEMRERFERQRDEKEGVDG